MKRQQFLAGLAALAAAPLVAGESRWPREAGGAIDEHWPLPDANDESFWQFLRGQFPLSSERAYLNTGGLGASPFVVIAAVKGKMDELEAMCETGHEDELWKTLKSSAAELLGCDTGEIAFVRNTTEGINIVANGFPFQRGDEVITTTQEHVGNAFPWLVLQKRSGIVLKFFEPSVVSAQENLDRIQKLITKKTRLISVPHAVTTTGLILPVKQIGDIARARKIAFFVDGAQTAGMFPFNLHEIGCDAYATSGHKWLMGPKETGLLYVRKDMLDTIQAKFVGAYSDGGFDFQRGTFALNPTAQRYEYGTVSVPLRVGLGAAVDFVRKIGIERIWERDRYLSTKLFEGLREIPDVNVLSPADGGLRSAMVTFMHSRIPHLALQEILTDRKLRTRSVTEGGLAALRISMHIYNTIEEVDRVLEGVRSAGKS